LAPPGNAVAYGVKYPVTTIFAVLIEARIFDIKGVRVWENPNATALQQKPPGNRSGVPQLEGVFAT
jgi:hypothetical protein